MTDVPVDPPKWRRDFPYTSGGEDDVTRREFTRYLVLGSGAFAVGTVAVAAWSSLRRTIWRGTRGRRLPGTCKRTTASASVSRAA